MANAIVRQITRENRRPNRLVPTWPGEGQIEVGRDGALECTWRASWDDVQRVDRIELLPSVSCFGNRILVRMRLDHEYGPIAFAAETGATPAMVSESRGEFRTIFLIDGKPHQFDEGQFEPTSIEKLFASHRPILRDGPAARVHTLLKSGLPCGSHPAVHLEISWARLYKRHLDLLVGLKLEGASLQSPSLVSQALELLVNGELEDSIKEVARLWNLDAVRLIHSVVKLSQSAESEPSCLAAQALLNMALLSSGVTSRGQVQPCMTWGWQATHRPLAVNATKLDIDSSEVEAESFWLRLPEPLACWNWHCFLDPSDVPASRSEIGDMLCSLPTSDDSEMDRLADNALDEIDAMSRWTVPPLARVRLDCGALATVDLVQFPTQLVAIFRNPANHFFVARLGVSDRQLDLILPNPMEFPSGIQAIIGMELGSTTRQVICSAVRLLLAAIWRDFTVPDVRPFAPSPRRGSLTAGRNPSQLTRFVYLPKVIYTGSLRTREALARLDAEDGGFKLQSQVAGYVRRAKRPAPDQLRLAAIWGISVPPEHTFVRPHVRMAAHRERVYRSRSYLNLILEPSTAVQSSEPDIWLDFEQSARRSLEDRGVEVARTAVGHSGDLILYGTDKQHGTTVAIAAFDDPTTSQVVHELNNEALRIDARTKYLVVPNQLDRVNQADASRLGIRVIRLARLEPK